jgi:hypothetical protein
VDYHGSLQLRWFPNIQRIRDMGRSEVNTRNTANADIGRTLSGHQGLDVNTLRHEWCKSG